MVESQRSLRDKVPGLRRISRIPQQVSAINPFDGDMKPTRAPICLAVSVMVRGFAPESI